MTRTIKINHRTIFLLSVCAGLCSGAITVCAKQSRTHDPKTRDCSSGPASVPLWSNRSSGERHLAPWGVARKFVYLSKEPLRLMFAAVNSPAPYMVKRDANAAGFLCLVFWMFWWMREKHGKKATVGRLTTKAFRGWEKWTFNVTLRWWSGRVLYYVLGFPVRSNILVLLRDMELCWKHAERESEKDGLFMTWWTGRGKASKIQLKSNLEWKYENKLFLEDNGVWEILLSLKLKMNKLMLFLHSSPHCAKTMPFVPLILSISDAFKYQ